MYDSGVNPLLSESGLCEFATLSVNSLGRERAENETDDDIRTPFMRDRDRIIHSKSFRRLMHKTQCFLSPEGDHYRTRLTHTLEVSQIGRTIARALRLNEDLTEAIALGHDLGHTPFGHAGERELDKLCPNGFKHNEQSLRVVEVIERDGKGLNLTKEVRNGIVCHTGKEDAYTPEGNIIKIADRIAYINHDIDDAIRAGILVAEDIPREYTDILGCSTSQRLNTMIHDIVKNSEGKPDIVMSAEVEKAMADLRKFMFANVYTNPKAKAEEQKAQDMLEHLFSFYKEHPEKMSEEYVDMLENRGESLEDVVCDYISGMTDQYAIQKFQEYFVPKSWS